MHYTEKKSRFQAVLENVRDACHFVSETAQQAGMSDDGIFQCDLSVEEIMTNIVEHGYKNQPTTELVEVLCRYTSKQFIIQISDSAPPFNPLTLTTPHVTTDLDELTAGGVGVHFVNQFMDEVTYEYRNGKNHLTMQRRIP